MTKMRLAMRVSALVTALAVVPAPGWGQGGAAPGGPAPSAPELSVSGGLGPMEFQGRGVTLGVGAVQIGLRRHLVIEPEVGRWVDADAPGLQADGNVVFETRRRTVTIAGANLLFRAGTARIMGFVGGGGGAHVVHDRFDTPVHPSTGAPIGGATVIRSAARLGLHGLGGADVVLAPRVRAFIALRGEVRPEPNVGMTAGMRWVLREAASGTPEPPAAARAAASNASGRIVEVLHLDGRRVRGRLVALSSNDVVIASRGSDLQVRLADVRHVRRPSHWARHLALAGPAVFGALAVFHCAARGCGGEGLAHLGAYGGIASGAGLAVGAMINAATATRRTVYP